MFGSINGAGKFLTLFSLKGTRMSLHSVGAAFRHTLFSFAVKQTAPSIGQWLCPLFTIPIIMMLYRIVGAAMNFKTHFK